MIVTVDMIVTALFTSTYSVEERNTDSLSWKFKMGRHNERRRKKVIASSICCGF